MDDTQWLLDRLLNQLQGGAAAEAAAGAHSLNWLRDAPAEELTRLLRGAIDQCPLDDLRSSLMRAAVVQLAQRLREGRRDWGDVESIVNLYRRLPAQSCCRGPLLQCLAEDSRAPALDALCQLLVDDPPLGGQDVALGLSPIFRGNPGPDAADPRGMFPQLLDGLKHLSIAAPILDLANFLFRQQPQGPHPGAGQTERLAALLGQLCHRMAYIEEDPRRVQDDSPDAGQIVAQGVPLAVALCDSLALIGDPEAAAPLHLALRLGHRRIRTEAAWALAKLGDEQGQAALIELASDPVARLRALHYADELGAGDQVDSRWREPAALAEAELCVWLAEPAQFGMPPTELELFDERTQYWPGYNDPLPCFLFRFVYRFPDRSFANVGIAGPLTHAFAADLTGLEASDIYAAFAGWQAEHDEIREVEPEQLTSAGRLELVRLERRLQDAGFEQVEPLRLGFFFGDRALVASAKKERVAGLAIADPDEISWFPTAPGRAANALGPREAFCIYKGRRLLRAFN